MGPKPAHSRSTITSTQGGVTAAVTAAENARTCFIFPEKVEQFGTALELNDVKLTQENLPDNVQAVITHLSTPIQVSTTEYNHLCAVLKAVVPAATVGGGQGMAAGRQSTTSDKNVRTAYVGSDQTPSLPEESRIPFPFRSRSEAMSFHCMTARLSNLSENTLANTWYSNLLSPPSLDVARAVNANGSWERISARWELLFDVNWKPGYYWSVKHHAVAAASGAVPGGKVIDVDNKVFMLQPDMFVNRRSRGIDFSLLLCEFKREQEDYSDLEKLLLEGFATLLGRWEYLTLEDHTPLRNSPLMWVPLIYCAGTTAQISLMWIVIDEDKTLPSFRYTLREDLSFNLMRPVESLKFSQAIARLAEKIDEQMSCEVMVSPKTINFKYISLGNPKRKHIDALLEEQIGNNDDTHSDGDDQDEAKPQDSKSKKPKTATKSAPAAAPSTRNRNRQGGGQPSQLSAIEIVVLEWGAQSFRRIPVMGPNNTPSEMFAMILCPPRERHPIAALIYDDRQTIVKIFKREATSRIPEDIQEEIDIQSALGEIPGTHVPRVLRTMLVEAHCITVVEMEDAGKSYPKAYSLDELKEMCRQLVSAMEVIHSHGYVHCDMKPGNVAVQRGDKKNIEELVVSILDWEAAKKLASPRKRFKGDARGTPGLMASEMEEHRMCTSAVDIYGLGLTFQYFATQLKRNKSDDKYWEAFESMVAEMTQVKPSSRPTASQLLECGFLESIAPDIPDAVAAFRMS